MGLKEPAVVEPACQLIAQRLKIHFNLHTHLWSVTALTGPRKGRVIAAVADATLSNAVFKVSTAGYRRAKREKKRNIHAWVIGTVIAVNTRPDLTGLVCVTYQPKPRDPYLDPAPGFRIRDRCGGGTGANITAAGLVVCAKTSLGAERGYAWIPAPTA